MKALVISLLIALPSAANAEHPELRLVQRGTESTLHDSDLLLKLIAVVESASVESTAYAHPAEKWERGLSAPVYIHARFDPDRLMQVERVDQSGREVVGVTEVLIVLHENGWTDHIWLRTANGYRSVTKYRPCVYTDLLLALPLANRPTWVTDMRDGYCARYPSG